METIDAWTMAIVRDIDLLPACTQAYGMTGANKVFEDDAGEYDALLFKVDLKRDEMRFYHLQWLGIKMNQDNIRSKLIVPDWCSWKMVEVY